MATPAVEKAALSALCQALADPAPKPLLGTKAKPGFFVGAAKKNKDAAKLLSDHRWVEGTGEYEGKGKSRKELHRLTPEGIEHALSSGEQAELLEGILGALDQNCDRLEGLQKQVTELNTQLQESDSLVENQKALVQKMIGKIVPPDIPHIIQQALNGQGTASPPPGPSSDTSWHTTAVQIVREFQQKNPYRFCPLPELYRTLSTEHPLTIGSFHDGLRELVQKQQLRLHPFTGSFSELVDEKYALLAAQEIKYYAECTA